MEKAIEAIETIEAKERVFESLKKLAAITGVVKNRCWWDTEVCPFYSEIKGFQEAGKSCLMCPGGRIDKERFFSILKEIALPDFVEEIELEDVPDLEEKIENAKKEGKEEGEKEGLEKGKEEAYEELAGQVDELIDGLIQKLRKRSK